MRSRQKVQHEGQQQQQYTRTLHAKAACKVLLEFILELLLRMGPSGDWTWKASWLLFLAPTMLVIVPINLYIGACNPCLVSERQKRNEGTAGFDRFLIPAAFISMPLRMLAAGLQHRQQLQARLEPHRLPIHTTAACSSSCFGAGASTAVLGILC